MTRNPRCKLRPEQEAEFREMYADTYRGDGGMKQFHVVTRAGVIEHIPRWGEPCWTLAQLAAVFAVSRTTVWREAKRLGLPPRQPRRA